MISLAEFYRVLAGLRALGFADGDIQWSETCGPPATAEDFALEAIYVICNSGMKNTVARKIYDKIRTAIEEGRPVLEVFGHKGKAGAIESIWRDRARLFVEYGGAADKVSYLASLPWIGEITKYHLAKNFGVDCVKPDVHLQRLANHHGTTPHMLCESLAVASGFRVRTVDLLLWRACANGLINSRTGEVQP
jgi:hypothetical protein